jgi:CubicO group peptidase (beta-lactamase class C family)
LDKRLVGTISDVPFDSFLEERIFKPLGMEDTGFFVPEQTSTASLRCILLQVKTTSVSWMRQQPARFQGRTSLPQEAWG